MFPSSVFSMIRCKREQENILLPLILCLAEKITFGFCHYICGVVKTFEKSHGIDEILVLFKYKFNLHTTVRCKLSTPNDQSCVQIYCLYVCRVAQIDLTLDA